MPYIPASRRPALDPIIEALQKRLRETGAVRGDVNYVVTRIALGVLAVTPGYQNYSDAVSALQDAADEIKRRCLGPYEDFACEKNGDVHEYHNADNKLDARWDESVRLKLDPTETTPQEAGVQEYKPLSGPATLDVVVKKNGEVFNIVDSPLPQVAAEQYQDLMKEVDARR